MPTYEFECEKCKKPFTVGQTLREYDQHEKPKCPRCGSRVVRQRVTSVHVQTGKKS
jgi:putative FmdB family regulatory protein